MNSTFWIFYITVLYVKTGDQDLLLITLKQTHAQHSLLAYSLQYVQYAASHQPVMNNEQQTASSCHDDVVMALVQNLLHITCSRWQFKLFCN